MPQRLLYRHLLLVAFLVTIFCAPRTLRATTALELQQQIKKSSAISKIEKEIVDYTAKATLTGGKTQTLKT